MATSDEILSTQVEVQFAKQIQTSKQIQEKLKEAIEVVGNAGRFQIILIVYLVICFMFATYLLLGTSYFFMNPNFTCNGASVSEEVACQQLQNCVLQNDYTITAYVGLYCDQKIIQRDLIQSMLGIGACLGVLFINFFSDYKGRKFSYIFSLIVGLIATAFLIIGAYTKTSSLFYLSQILAGFCGNSLLTLVYVMSDRLMSKKYSSQTILITNAFFGVAEIGLILFTGALNWQHLAIIFMLIPGIAMTIVATFFIIEDPMFLFTKTRYEECKKSIEVIATYNRTQGKLPQSYQIIDQLVSNHVDLSYDAKKQAKSQAQSPSPFRFLRLLLKREIFIPIILIGIFNFGGNLVYYILSYAISTTGSSFNSEIVLFGIVQFVGIFPMMFLGQKTPRKMGLIVIMAINTVISFAFVFDLPVILQTVIIVAIRFTLTSIYMLYIFLVVETFPQHIQATSFGVIEFLSQIGKFLAPFTITLATALNTSPILIVAFICLTCGIATMFPIKETLVKKVKVSEKDESLLDNASIVTE